MPPSTTKTNERALDQFLRELDATNDQTQKLLNVVREAEIDIASHKTELRILSEDVREIAAIVRGDDGELSLMTRLVLLEKNFERLEKNIEERFKELKDETKNKSGEDKNERKTLAEAQIVESKNKWQTYTALGSAFIALLGTVVTLVANYVGK